jgi:hypothetical protein
MSGDGLARTRRSFWASLATLLASSGTLVCCALPALLVTAGAGAALASLVSAVPQLVWLSEHKESLFAAAGLMLAGSGALQWANRRAPCPVDPQLRQACLSTRRNALRIYWFSLAIYLVGGWFAFAAPALAG